MRLMPRTLIPARPCSARVWSGTGYLHASRRDPTQSAAPNAACRSSKLVWRQFLQCPAEVDSIRAKLDEVIRFVFHPISSPSAPSPQHRGVPNEGRRNDNITDREHCQDKHHPNPTRRVRFHDHNVPTSLASNRNRWSKVMAEAPTRLTRSGPHGLFTSIDKNLSNCCLVPLGLKPNRVGDARIECSLLEGGDSSL